MKTVNSVNKISKNIAHFDFVSKGNEILGTSIKKHNVFSLRPYLLKNIAPFKVMP